MPARAFQDNPEPFKAIQRYLIFSKTVQSNFENSNSIEQSNSFENTLEFQLGVSPRKTAQNDAFKTIQRHPDCPDSPEQSTLIQRQRLQNQRRTFLNWNRHGTVSACLTPFRGRRLPRRRRLRSGAPFKLQQKGQRPP